MCCPAEAPCLLLLHLTRIGQQKDESKYRLPFTACRMVVVQHCFAATRDILTREADARGAVGIKPLQKDPRAPLPHHQPLPCTKTHQGKAGELHVYVFWVYLGFASQAEVKGPYHQPLPCKHQLHQETAAMVSTTALQHNIKVFRVADRHSVGGMQC